MNNAMVAKMTTPQFSIAQVATLSENFASLEIVETATKSPSFLAFAPEVRNNIYKHLFDMIILTKDSASSEDIVECGILTTCSTIYDEAKSFLANARPTQMKCFRNARPNAHFNEVKIAKLLQTPIIQAIVRGVTQLTIVSALSDTLGKPERLARLLPSLRLVELIDLTIPVLVPILGDIEYYEMGGGDKFLTKTAYARLPFWTHDFKADVAGAKEATKLGTMPRLFHPERAEEKKKRENLIQYTLHHYTVFAGMRRGTATGMRIEIGYDVETFEAFQRIVTEETLEFAWRGMK